MEVISTRRYEARPPSNHPALLIDPENSVALVKEEEWETRKKKEITTTRQIETRVKRQVVLEDGEVVEDSGPFVTTNTTEDVEQQEHTTQERRTNGDQPQEVEWPSTRNAGSLSDGTVVQKELNETVVRSREEIEERLETEDRQQLGDISDELYQRAVRNNRGDLRVALAESSKQITSQTGPRVVQHTTRSNKVVDTEKTLEKKELKADGLIVTETKKTVEHEEIKDDEVPDDGSGKDEATEVRKEGTQRFLKKRDEDVVDYISGGERVAREMRYVAETTEGERIGDWSPPPNAMRPTRLRKHSGEGAPGSRKDALTKKPLDLEEEDEARKFETSKWLESHFGSESRSSHGSIDTDDSPVPTATNTSYINVTMKSYPGKERQKRTTNGESREVSSPSGFFHGISEWSERHQTKDKRDNYTKASSPPRYVDAAPRTNGHIEKNRNQTDSSYSRTYEHVRRQEVQERPRTPSPPIRRKAREQFSRSEERRTTNETGRTASPVHVIQRTWETRSKDVQGQNGYDYDNHKKKSLPRSRSVSPRIVPIIVEEKKSHETTSLPRPSKGQSKYKIGESFRKLVGKLRSASSERKNKKSSSTSQLTQTDDNGPTYLQYNVIDRNIPLVCDVEGSKEKPPERPPRSPRIKSAKPMRNEHHEQLQRSESTPPVHRYYLGEDPFGGSIYGREKGYKDAKKPVRQRSSRSILENEYSVSSNSLGRFSKSTSRLATEYEREEYHRTTQTLPRNHHSSGDSKSHASRRQAYQPNVRTITVVQESPILGEKGRFRESSTNVKQNGRYRENSPGVKQNGRYRESSPGIKQNGRYRETSPALKQNGKYRESSPAMKPNGGYWESSPITTNQSKKYGSMINISIKNITSPSQSPIYHANLQGPVKPERTNKSLSRSKSFSVEEERTPVKIPYTSNLQLNRLDETPPLKSPGILASISRSNRDLFKDSRHEY
ncbi:uncharacterized protein chas isoform X2 [Prorops nasuta]|uniref:uncharacterized protein chas isoform X2 n=1 Tax=Prorops nasuta TaxID=863751 RepID=UPI0034CFA514